MKIESNLDFSPNPPKKCISASSRCQISVITSPQQWPYLLIGAPVFLIRLNHCSCRYILKKMMECGKVWMQVCIPRVSLAHEDPPACHMGLKLDCLQQVGWTLLSLTEEGTVMTHFITPDTRQQETSDTQIPSGGLTAICFWKYKHFDRGMMVYIMLIA